MSPVPWNGSNILYQRLIRPFVLRHESHIDDTISKARQKASHFTGGFVGERKSYFNSVHYAKKIILNCR